MIDLLKGMAASAAEGIQELPPMVRYPVYILLAGLIPTVTVYAAIAGASVAITIAPLLVVIVVVWLLANRVDW